MQRTCPSCGADPGAGSFCQHCGTALTADSAGSGAPESTQSTTPAPPQQPAPTPPNLPQAPRGRSRLGTGCLIIALIILALLAVGAFLVWQFINDEVIPGIEEATGAFSPISESPPGPCFDVQSEGGVLTDWDEITCDGPRDMEVSFAASFEEGPFPGDEYLVDTAEATCLNAFETYVGLAPEQSQYDYDFLLPTAEMWADGRRNGICLVVADDRSPLVGLVKGSGK